MSDEKPPTGAYRDAHGMCWAVNGVDVFKECIWEESLKDRDHLRSGLCVTTGAFRDADVATDTAPEKVPELRFMSFNRGDYRKVTWMCPIETKDLHDEIERLKRSLDACVSVQEASRENRENDRRQVGITHANKINELNAENKRLRQTVETATDRIPELDAEIARLRKMIG